MHLDLKTLSMLIVCMGVAWLMVATGVGKHVLEWRRRRHVCPSCGRSLDGDGCSCLD